MPCCGAHGFALFLDGNALLLAKGAYDHRLGLALSRTERDVLLAAHSLTSCVDDEISTEQIRKHSLLEPVAQATLYRAIRTLLGYGLLEQTGQSRGRNYVVRSDLVGKDLPPS